jgi:Mn-dependent DtxR family transcriptional regulator
MKMLNISPDLAIPPDIVTSTTIIYGGKGMGKTNLGSVIVEELARAGLRWSALDPMGVFWGLRHSADGKGPGIECVILGGTHGDIPIEPTGGATVADLVIDESANTIIDFSRRASGKMWSKGEKIRFVTEYANRLFERQGELVKGRRRDPILQILDEAARYIPQQIPANSPMLAECVGAWEQIAEEGRNIGLGIGFLTQRSARMNKSVSELADVMFAFRTVGPNSVRAIVDWLGEHIEKERVREVAGKVRELDVGQALIVSPGWLRVEKIARIRERQTFDSSATPKPGQQRRRVTGPAAKPDLEKYRARMIESIEKAKAEDPKELRLQIKQRDDRIRQLEKGAATKTVEKTVVDQGAIDRAVKAAIAKQRKDIRPILDRLQRMAIATTLMPTAVGELATIVNADPPAPERAVAVPAAKEPRLAIARPTSTPASDEAWRERTRQVVEKTADDVERAVHGELTMTGGKQKIVDAIANLNALGVEKPTIIQVALFNGVSHTTGTFKQNIRELVGMGLIERDAEGVELTSQGKAVAAEPDTDRTDNPIAFWKEKLGSSRAAVLQLIVDAFPKSIERESIAQKLGKSPTTGTFKQDLRDMRSYGLIEFKPDGAVRANDVLFPLGV